MTGEAGLEDLRRRMAKVEREHRRLRVATTALALVVSVLMVMAQARPGGESIEAQEFVLRDANGKQRAKLEADSVATVLSLYDAGENVRARLGVGDKTVLLMFDPAREGPYARLRLALGVGGMGGGADDAGPHLLFWDVGRQEPRVEVYSTPQFAGMLIRDDNGRQQFRAP